MQETFLQLISFGTIVLLVAIVSFLVLEFFSIKNPVKNFIKKNQMVLIFVTSLFSVVGSLSLSIYFKLAPCELCWYQRVFLFTVPIISWIAVYKKDVQARLYVFILAAVGAIIASYHALIQSTLLKSDSVFCNPISTGVDCAVPAFTYFGFVTVPVISLAVFGLIMISSYGYKD